jgi:hypothetical protein
MPSGARVLGILAAIAFSGLFATPLAVAYPVPQNTADLGTQTGFGRLAVDGVRGRVFVSEPEAGAVAELDSQGDLLRTISGLPGAYGLAIGGNYLYIAAQKVGSIARIDLGSPSPSAQTFVSGLPNPTWLAVAANRLWVGTAPQATGDSSIIAIDLSTGAQQSFGNGAFYGADFATSPADPDALYMAEAEVDPEPLHRYDISTFPPRETASNPGYRNGPPGGMALSSDGSRLEGADGGDDAFQELCSQTLQPDGVVYPGAYFPAAVATSATGILATGLGSYNSPNLAAYRIGVTTPYWTATTPSEDGIHDAGVAIAPDGSTLYAAVDGTAPGGPALLIETYNLPAAPNPTAADPCPKPSGGTSETTAPSPTQPSTTTSSPTMSSTTTISRSGRKVTGKLRVRLSRHRVRRPTAAFLLTLTLQPRSQGQTSYRYSLTLTGLRCAGEATTVSIDFGARHTTLLCTRHVKHVSGTVGRARSYRVRVIAVRQRRHHPAVRGSTDVLALRMP